MGPIAKHGSVWSPTSSVNQTHSQQSGAELFRLSAQKGEDSSLLCVPLSGPAPGKRTFDLTLEQKSVVSYLFCHHKNLQKSINSIIGKVRASCLKWKYAKHNRKTGFRLLPVVLKNEFTQRVYYGSGVLFSQLVSLWSESLLMGERWRLNVVPPFLCMCAFVCSGFAQQDILTAQ